MTEPREKPEPHPQPLYDLGTILQVLRVCRGWKQQDLARAAGIPASTLCAYEKGDKFPELGTLARIMAALGFPFAAIDLTRSYLAALEVGYWPAAGSPPPGPASLEALPAEIRALAAEFNHAFERLSRIERSLPEGSPRAEEPRPPALDISVDRTVELWSVLKRHSFAEQKVMVRDDLAFRHLGLCERLCQESERQAARRPKKALGLAGLALTLAERIGREEGRGAYLRALAGAHWGNALRADGKLPAAEALFAEAGRLWGEAVREGEAPPAHEARILDLESSLRTTQRRLPEAIELIDRAMALDSTPAVRGRLLIKKSRILEEQENLAGALALLQEAEPLVDPAAEPRLVLCLRHNRADYLSKLGRYEEAEALLPGVRTLSRKLNNELDLVRLRWLEARVEAGLGRKELAIGLLKKVRGEFAIREIDYDTALVTLELAALLAEEGRNEEVKALARHLVPLFEAQKVHREALAALALFRQAAERERVTVELAHQLLDFLGRARHDPALRFEKVAG